MFYRFLLLIFISELLTAPVRSQSFVKQFTSSEDEYVYSAMELPEGGYLLYMVRGDYLENDPGRVGHRDLIIKLDHEGNELDSIQIEETGNVEFRANGFIDLLDQFIFWGSTYSGDDLTNPVGFRMIRMDYQFGMLHDTSCSFPAHYLLPGKMILNSANHLVLAGAVMATDFSDIQWFCREMSVDGELIKEKYYQEPVPYQSVAEIPGIHTYHLIDFFRIAEIDSNFTLVKIIYTYIGTPTSILTNLFSPKATGESGYLISGNCYSPDHTYQGAWGFMENDSFSTIFTFGSADTNSYNSGMDFISTQRIFSALSRVISAPSPFVRADNEMLLYCTSINQTVNWEQRYDDLGYILSGIPVATSDSGCLWLGNYWNWHDKTHHDFDAVVLKLNPDGTLITGKQTPEIAEPCISVYPNPGKGLVVYITLDDSGILLMNAMHQVVLNRRLSAGKNKVSTGNLPPGFYHYQIEHHSKIISSGTWIKPSD